jgi:Metallo-peptidase family M12
MQREVKHDPKGGSSADMPQWRRKSPERIGSGNVWNPMNARPVKGRATRIRGRYFLSVFMLSMGVLLVFLTSALTAQAEELILPLLNNQIREEGPAQKQIVERLQSLPTTQSLELVRINADALHGTTTQLSTPNVPTITLSKSYDNVTDAANFTWYGTLAGTPGQATLVVRNNNVTGSIQDGETIYSIEPIGNGVHALIKIDQGRFPPEDPTSLKELEGRSSVLKPTVPGSERRSDDRIGIGVLVAYTTAARDNVHDIDGLIQLAVAQTNRSYSNSKINIRLYLAGSVYVPYSEVKENGTQKNEEEIRDELWVNKELKNQRDASGAALVAVIIGKNKYCGLSKTILADASTAFSVVNYDCMTANYSFTHELGHLMGARHDENHHKPEINEKFHYAHGYQHPSSKKEESFRTIMAYACDKANPCNPIIPYWSNPDVSYAKIPTGTAELNDNALMLRVSAETVAAFRAPIGYAFCANENEHCSITETENVAYGAKGKYVYASRTSGFDCNNATFGEDPVDGATKACYAGPAKLAFCASENETCNFAGTMDIAYGVNGKYSYKSGTGSIDCNDTTFGDPADGITKTCYVVGDKYTRCAPQGGFCKFTAKDSSVATRVLYGANGKFAYKVTTSDIACNSATFGDDPIPGVDKACYIMDQEDMIGSR